MAALIEMNFAYLYNSVQYAVGIFLYYGVYI